MRSTRYWGVCGFLEGGQGGEGIVDEFLGGVDGLVDSEDGGPGGFVGGRVFAGGFAEFSGALGHVEDIVDDLEGETGLFAKGAEAACVTEGVDTADPGGAAFLLFDGSAEGGADAIVAAVVGAGGGGGVVAEETAGDDCDVQQRAGFGAVDAFD